MSEKPDPHPDRLAAAAALEMHGETEPAISAWEEVVAQPEPGENVARARKHLGNLYLHSGKLRRARKHLREACKLEPDCASFWHDLSIVHYYLADFLSTVKCARKALDIDPDLKLARFWLASALYHRGELDEAAKTFEALLELYPNFTIANFQLGVIHQRRGDLDKAEEQFRIVLLKNPEDAAARHYLEL
ncbi:hypothetical protein DRQ53_03460 [bacterium]|nr:MAG: hypothetical protein DRQ53_03460 [bacterium]